MNQDHTGDGLFGRPIYFEVFAFAYSHEQRSLFMTTNLWCVQSNCIMQVQQNRGNWPVIEKMRSPTTNHHLLVQTPTKYASNNIHIDFYLDFIHLESLLVQVEQIPAIQAIHYILRFERQC